VFSILFLFLFACFLFAPECNYNKWVEKGVSLGKCDDDEQMMKKMNIEKHDKKKRQFADNDPPLQHFCNLV